MRILFLAQLLPYPPVCGGTIKSYNVLKHLCESHDVTLLSFVRREPDKEQLDVLRGMCRDVIFCHIRRSGFANLRDAALSIAAGRSFIIARDHIDEMKQAVEGLLGREEFDLLYVDHLQMSQYVKDFHGCPKVLDEHNVEWRIVRRIASGERSPLKRLFASIEWPKLRSYELRTSQGFDLVLTVSEEDKRTLVDESEGAVRALHVPIGVDLDLFQPVTLDPDSKMILSTATMSWPPNIDAALYFYNDVFPFVRARQPRARLVLAGSRPPSSIASIPEKDPAVSVPGFVDDIRSLAAGAAAFIVPLRSGSGMRVKILNAMALGLPVVSTSVGCEGIPAVPGRDILVADEPKVFAELTASLLADPILRFRIGSNGRKFVEREFGWQAILPRLDEALAEIAQKVGRRISA